MKLINKFSLLITSIMLLNLYACNIFASTPNVTPLPILPTSTRQVSIPTSTFLPIAITPSPLPTQPIIFAITPDAIQVAKWKEYENALAIKLLPPDSLRGEVLCEWKILGRSEQETYVWAFCQSPPYSVSMPASGASIPAVIYLDVDGVVQSVEIPGSGTAYARDIRELFPTDIQEMIFKHSVDTVKMEAHINSRRENPEPPLIILSANTFVSSTIEPTPTEIQLPYNLVTESSEYCQVSPPILPLDETKNLSEDQIVYKLVDIWLSRYKKPEAHPYCRIDDYTIDRVYYDKRITSPPIEPQGDIMRVVVFSLKLIQIPNDWMSLAGEIDQNNWLHITQTFAIFKTDTGYVMKFAFP